MLPYIHYFKIYKYWLRPILGPLAQCHRSLKMHLSFILGGVKPLAQFQRIFSQYFLKVHSKTCLQKTSVLNCLIYYFQISRANEI